MTGTYKFLAADARGRFSDTTWPAPSPSEPGDWVTAGGPLEQCRRGIHACTAVELLDWVDDELWEVELGGEVVRTQSGLLAERGRLVRRVRAWDAALALELARWCVARVRERAVEALRRDSCRREAEALASARTLAEVYAVAAAAAKHGPATATATGAVAFAADCMLLVSGARPDEERERAGGPAQGAAAAIAANLAFVSAHAIAAAGDDYDAAFGAERKRQRDWLLAQLAL